MISCGNFFIVENEIVAIIVLMFFAYLISLCSTSDSFVGQSLHFFYCIMERFLIYTILFIDSF